MSKNKIWLVSNQKVALIAKWQQNQRDEEHRKGRWSEKRTNKSLQVLRSFCFVVCFLFRSEAPRLPKEEEEEEKTWSIMLVYIPTLFVLRLPKNSPTPPSSLLHRSAHTNKYGNVAINRPLDFALQNCKKTEARQTLLRSHELRSSRRRKTTTIRIYCVQILIRTSKGYAVCTGFFTLWP